MIYNAVAPSKWNDWFTAAFPPMVTQATPDSGETANQASVENMLYLNITAKAQVSETQMEARSEMFVQSR